jgi:LysM repeat protein
VFTSLAAVPLIAWAFVMVLGAGDAAAQSGAASSATSFEYVTVDRGDSLWGIAESIAPHADPRVIIDEIIRLNGLDGAIVEPGQRLALPVVP